MRAIVCQCRNRAQRKPRVKRGEKAGRTGLEPATTGSTVRYPRQVNPPVLRTCGPMTTCAQHIAQHSASNPSGSTPIYRRSSMPGRRCRMLSGRASWPWSRRQTEIDRRRSAMGWERREASQYYYRKIRRGGRATLEYAGCREFADLVSLLDEERWATRQEQARRCKLGHSDAQANSSLDGSGVNSTRPRRNSSESDRRPGRTTSPRADYPSTCHTPTAWRISAHHGNKANQATELDGQTPVGA